MRAAILVCFLCVSLTTARAGGDKEEGFVPLFDGKSFAGWKADDKTAKSWKVENGMMVLLGGGNSIYTDKNYDNYILRLEFRPEKKGYNSGLFLRGNNQINLAQKDAGRLMTHKGTKAVPELHKEPGEWNTWEVSVIGDKVSLKVNGKLAWDVDGFKPVTGPIGIQAEGAHIDFKNIRIKVVPAK